MWRAFLNVALKKYAALTKFWPVFPAALANFDRFVGEPQSTVSKSIDIYCYYEEIDNLNIKGEVKESSEQYKFTVHCDRYDTPVNTPNS